MKKAPKSGGAMAPSVALLTTPLHKNKKKYHTFAVLQFCQRILHNVDSFANHPFLQLLHYYAVYLMNVSKDEETVGRTT